MRSTAQARTAGFSHTRPAGRTGAALGSMWSASRAHRPGSPLPPRLAVAAGRIYPSGEGVRGGGPARSRDGNPGIPTARDEEAAGGRVEAVSTRQGRPDFGRLGSPATGD